MTTTTGPTNSSSNPSSTDANTKQSRSISPVMTVVICILSMVAGALGYRAYSTMNSVSAPEPSLTTIEPSASPSAENRQPSPTPITLHAGIGDYAVSHPKTGGPTIQRVVFDPLDAKKGQPLKLSAVILNSGDNLVVTGGLTTDSQHIGLTFTKTATEGNAQIWSTVITLPDSVLYNYVFSVTATDAQGKTVVRVSPRS